MKDKKPNKNKEKEPDKFEATVKRMLETPPKPKKDKDASSNGVRQR